jgi:hypothetical protein
MAEDAVRATEICRQCRTMALKWGRVVDVDGEVVADSPIRT